MKISQTKLIEIINKTNGHCFYCNGKAEAIDHFFSKNKHQELNLNSLGIDNNDIENLIPSCKSCNSSKSDKFAEDFFGNSFKIWSRYYRANKRIGYGGGKSECFASFGLEYK